jgi:NADH-ubiquinone oxidoreductase chain 5
MAAPTPVSALVHSSTLVTAGIYLIIRFYYLLEKWVFLGIRCFSLFTVFIARLAACSEMDMKKVIAFSTLRQLGVMGVSLRMGLVKLCLFHLMIHAIFKANMFICAGYFLMKKNHNQDLRLLKKLQRKNILDITLLFSLLKLKGVCYLAGFYSKDRIFDILL